MAFTCTIALWRIGVFLIGVVSVRAIICAIRNSITCKIVQLRGKIIFISTDVISSYRDIMR
jgi:hypothetical protein